MKTPVKSELITRRISRVSLLFSLSLVLFVQHTFSAEKVPTRFNFKPPISAKTVFLAGTFNNWDKTAQPMDDSDGDGVWEVTILLLPGEYQYKFVLDNEKWYQDPKNKLGAPDGFGGLNSVIRVGDYEKLNLPTKSGDGKILKEALFHEPESPYLVAPSSQEIVIKLRVKRNDVSRCVLHLLKPEKQNVPMFFYARDAVFEYYRAPVDVTTEKIEYFFSVEDENMTVLYTPETKSEVKAGTSKSREEEFPSQTHGGRVPGIASPPFSYYPSGLIALHALATEPLHNPG